MQGREELQGHIITATAGPAKMVPKVHIVEGVMQADWGYYFTGSVRTPLLSLTLVPRY